MTRNWACLALLANLAGCGFSPLYASHDGQAGAGAALGTISVALIPDRNGQVLRQDLQERLERDGDGVASRYDLYVYLGIGASDIGITQESAATHERVNASASWTLKAQDANHTVIASGTAHALDGFDYINQQFFAGDLAREQAYGRVDETLSDEITQQLAVYFRMHKIT